MPVGGRRATVIAANSDVGVLYGAFHLLRLLQTQQPLAGLAVVAAPRTPATACSTTGTTSTARSSAATPASRSGTGTSCPTTVDPRYTDYARANASIGINGDRAHQRERERDEPHARSTSRKAAALADVFRPYGIRVYLTARFSAPIEIGGLKTADPLDPAVRGLVEAQGRRDLPR